MDEVRAMCRRAGVREIEEIRPLAGGYSNRNCLVKSRNASFGLRIYRSDGVAQREARLHALVRERVLVPEILYVEPDAAVCGSPFALMSFVEGIRLDDVLKQGIEVESAGSAAGSALAAIGSFEFERSGFLDANLVPCGRPRADESVIEYVAERLQAAEADHHLAAGTSDRVLGLMADVLRQLPDLGRQTSLVHCDFNPKNIVMRLDDGGWLVAAVLDWEFAFSGTPLWDVANMLRHGDEGPADFYSAFVEAFSEAGGELPEGWESAGRLIDTVNLAEFLARGPNNPFFQFAQNRFTAIAAGGRF